MRLAYTHTCVDTKVEDPDCWGKHLAPRVFEGFRFRCCGVFTRHVLERRACSRAEIYRRRNDELPEENL